MPVSVYPKAGHPGSLLGRRVQGVAAQILIPPIIGPATVTVAQPKREFSIPSGTLSSASRAIQSPVESGQPNTTAISSIGGQISCRKNHEYTAVGRQRERPGPSCFPCAIGHLESWKKSGQSWRPARRVTGILKTIPCRCVFLCSAYAIDQTSNGFIIPESGVRHRLLEF